MIGLSKEHPICLSDYWSGSFLAVFTPKGWDCVGLWALKGEAGIRTVMTEEGVFQNTKTEAITLTNHKELQPLWYNFCLFFLTLVDEQEFEAVHNIDHADSLVLHAWEIITRHVLHALLRGNEGQNWIGVVDD